MANPVFDAVRTVLAVVQFGVPDEYDVLAVVPFGYPKRKLGLGKKNRKPAGEVVSNERYGTNWKG